MTRAATWLLTAGALLFIGVLASQGLPAVLSALAAAGWGLVLVALFHLLPLALDAAAIRVLCVADASPTSMRDALLTRWAGESANSFLPAGQIGGPVLMARHLAHQGMPMHDAAAAITVSTTLQTVAQITFALFGVALLGAQAGHISEHALRMSALVASGFLAVQIGGFYLLQRRGFFSKLIRAATRFAGQRDWSQWVSRAEAIDLSIQGIYARGGLVAASFVLSLVGWVVGTGEVYLILQLLGHPASWLDSLLLESLGQAIRGAAFAVPGALGVQESGYLLLAPLAGLPTDAALALSLAKRTREILLGLPGLLYLHLSERLHIAERAGAAATRPVPP
jgi:putative membrane protein